MQLKWHHQFQFAGYYAAKELGFYQQENLDVTVIPASDAKNPIENVLDGNAQYGVGSNDLIIKRNAGKPVVVLAVIFQHSPYVLLAMHKKGVNNVHDLIGKKIMLDPYATEIMAYFSKSNIPLDRVNIIHKNDYSANDLLSGATDAYAGYVTNDTFYLDKASADYLTFSPQSEGIDFYGDNLFTSESEINQHPERVKAFLRASIKGWEYAVNHPEKTIDLMIASGYVTSSEREKLLYEAQKTIPFIHPDIVPIGFMRNERWQHILETYIDQNMLPRASTLKGFLYSDKADTVPTKLYAWLSILGILFVITTYLAIRNYSLKQNLFKKFFYYKNRYEKIINRVPGIVFEYQLSADGTSKIPYATASFEQLFQFNHRDYAKKWPKIIRRFHREDAALLISSLKDSAAKLSIWQVECRLRGKQGQLNWVKINALPEKTSDGSIVWYGIISDITEQKLAEAHALQTSNELLFLSAHDALTKLPNRNQMHQYLSVKIDGAKNSNKRIALFLMDLDQFKEVNDTLGHFAGDQLIIAVSDRLLACTKELGLVCRLGGDEFVIIMSDIGSDTHQTIALAKHIIDEMGRTFIIDHTELNVTASIGIAIFPTDGEDIHNLLKHADQAMYRAKLKGRNGYYMYTPELNSTAENRMTLIKDLREAIALKQFHLDFQPIVDLKTGEISKAEALLRWKHPKHGLVSPNQFIKVAEETGLIVEIGNWVLSQAVEQTNKIRASYHKDFTISINKSPVQLQNEGKSKQSWLDLMHKLNPAENSLMIEITEGVFLDQNQTVLSKLSAFKTHGLQLGIDDFGTGYASISYIQKFDIDFIKLDMSFVQGISQNTHNIALCEAMIVMAHKLGLKVIAEGIETEEQYARLIEIGCDYGQGFYMYKPMPAEALESLLSNKT